MSQFGLYISAKENHNQCWHGFNTQHTQPCLIWGGCQIRLKKPHRALGQKTFIYGIEKKCQIIHSPSCALHSRQQAYSY